MLRAHRHVPRASLGALRVLDTITLDRQGRYRRRVVLTSDGGTEFLLDLERPTHLAPGDGLVLETGEAIEVLAAAEPLLAITAADTLAQARIAWHLGNRHTACEITPAAIYIQPDHVLAEMAVGLGGQVTEVVRPFEPERGAYGGHAIGGARHSHSHSHGHAHGTATDDTSDAG
jgi:urease accessory protein